MANGDENVPEMHVQEVEEHEQDSLVKKIKMAGLGLIAVAIVAVGYTVIAGSAEQAEQQASWKLGRAANAFLTGNYQVALQGNPAVITEYGAQAGLVDVVDGHSGTGAAEVAALMAGRALLFNGEVDNAKDMFTKAAASSNSVVSSGGNAGLGACESTNGNNAAAAQAYVVAADKAISEYNAAMYRSMAADLYVAAGDQANADKQFAIIAAMSGNNQYIAEARELAK